MGEFCQELQVSCLNSVETTAKRYNWHEDLKARSITCDAAERVIANAASDALGTPIDRMPLSPLDVQRTLTAG